MNNFTKRLLTGTFIVLAVVLSIIVHPYAYMSLFAFSSILLMKELEEMICKTKNPLLLINSVTLGAGVFVLSFLHFYIDLSSEWFLALLLLPLLPFLAMLYSKQEDPFNTVASYTLIVVYISLPFFSLNLLAFSEGYFDPLLLLAFFILIWVNDTGAYIVGVNFGKTRLFERISPKKSWEGFWGGLVSTVIAAYFLFVWIEQGSLALWLISGLAVSIFATLGDLVESMLKRSVNIKDSGKLLPGHGGLLDRFDGALFAAPVMSLIFYLFDK